MTTEDLIADSTIKTRQASALFDQINAELSYNREIALNVMGLIGQVASASHEQAQGIEQINRAVAEMDKGVQQTAAQSEESASAAEEMTGQTYQMKGTVRNLVVMIQGTA